MKVNKKGELKLDKCETKIGNFVFRDEKEYIKISAISGAISWRVSLFTSIGMLLKQCLDGLSKENDNFKVFLECYCISIYTTLSVCPDVGVEGDKSYNFLVDLVNLSDECINRHKELYGFEEDPSEEKNEADLQAVKEQEAIKEELLNKE